MAKKDQSSNSHEKGDFSKKNAEGTSRRTKRSKIKPSKEIISSEESSSEELVNIDESRKQRAQLISCATVDESSRKESVRKLKVERITPSTSELLKKEHTTKQTVEESSSNKGKAYKRITSRGKKFSDEIENAGSSRARPYPMHSRASSEDNSHLKTSKKMERKRPSSSKSLRKIDFTKKNVEKTLQPPQSSRRTGQKVDCCEESSSESFLEEPSDDANPPTSSGFSATGVGNRRKEWCNYQSLPAVINRTENRSNKQTHCGEKITFDIFPSFGNKSDARDDRIDAGEFSQESPTSEVFPGCGNLSKSGISKPFSNWADISYVMRPTYADEEPENDDTGVQDGDRARMDPKQTNKDFQKFRKLKIQQDNKEKQSTSKTDHSESQSQKDAFISITPMVNLTVETKRKNGGTEAASNAFAENSPKGVNNDIVKKESEKLKDLTIMSKIDEAKDADKMPTYGGSNENITDLKSPPVTAKNKGGLKRLSDPSYILKENRQPPSI